MNDIRYFELLQKYTELQKAFDDTLEMNRKFGTENVRLEKENEQLKKDLERANKIIEQYNDYLENEFSFDENGDVVF